MITLPKKYKKEITALIKEYNRLLYRKIEVRIPAQKLKIDIVWHHEFDYDAHQVNYDIYDIIEKHKLLAKYDKQLKAFCVKVGKLSKKVYGDKMAIWENLLWPSEIPEITWK